MSWIVACLLICIAFASVAEATVSIGAHAELVEAMDGSFVLPKNDAIISMHTKHYGQFERPLVQFALDIMAVELQRGDAIVLDVGTNLGTWAVPFAKAAGPRGKVYAFEAQRHMLSHLGATLVANSLSNVYLIHCVVSNVTGGLRQVNDIAMFSDTVAMNFGGLSMMSTLGDSKAGDSGYSLVPALSLDAFFAGQLQSRCPAFVKLDIELYELYALMGAGTMLLECQPVLLLEALCPLLNRSLFLLLEHLGYTLAWVRLPAVDYNAAQAAGLQVDTSWLLGLSEEHFNIFFFGGINVLALPRRRYDALAVLARHPSVLFPIDTASGRFTIEEYDLSYCIHGLGAGGQARCGKFYLQTEPASSWQSSGTEERTACGGNQVPEFLIDYWKRFE